MCRATTCKRCGRPTWKGCGMHVEQVLGHVPERRRCHCGSGDAATGPSSTTAAARKRWFSRS